MVGVLEDFTPKGCESENMDSFLLADTQMPILNTEEAWQKADSLKRAPARQAAGPRTSAVAVVLNTLKYEVLTNRMKEKFYQTVDLSTSKVTLVFNNDERNAVTFVVRNAFVNAEPVHGEREYKLERRHGQHPAVQRRNRISGKRRESREASRSGKASRRTSSLKHFPAILDKEPRGVRLHPLMQQRPVVFALAELCSHHLVESVYEVAAQPDRSCPAYRGSLARCRRPRWHTPRCSPR